MAGLVSDDDLSDNRSDCSEQDRQIDGTNEKRLKVKMEEESKGEISPIDENEEWAKVTKNKLRTRKGNQKKLLVVRADLHSVSATC